MNAGPVFVPPIHIVTTVGTVGGDLAHLFSSSGPTVATNRFLDLENMLLVSSTPVLLSRHRSAVRVEPRLGAEQLGASP